MTTATNAAFIGLLLQNSYSVEGWIDFWLGGGKGGGGEVRFSKWGDEQIFGNPVLITFAPESFESYFIYQRLF